MKMRLVPPRCSPLECGRNQARGTSVDRYAALKMPAYAQSEPAGGRPSARERWHSVEVDRRLASDAIAEWPVITRNAPGRIMAVIAAVAMVPAEVIHLVTGTE